MKEKYAFVLKSIEKLKKLSPKCTDLTGKTYIVSGSSRGIGYNIAKKLVQKGANVTITGKTKTPHPKLEGTIYSALEELNKLAKHGNTVIAIPCDIRNPTEIDNAVDETIKLNGGIDGVVLNASALCLNDTLHQTRKEVELMSNVNINGTYLFGQKCIQHMHKNEEGHMLVISPPIDMLHTDHWWTNHMYYSMSKFNMSLMAKYWNKEFPNIGVNTLWPRTTINTAPVQNLLGGDEMVKLSRTTDIMGDAAYHVLATDPMVCNGNNYIDDEILASLDIDVEQYRVNPWLNEKDLMPDFFC